MISPKAEIDPKAKIGKNVTIYPFAYIEGDVEIGDDCVIYPYVSILNGTKMGRGNKVYQNTVLGAEPQDFNYTGDETELIIGDENIFRENVVINRATFKGGQTVIGNRNFFMEGVHVSHDTKIHDGCVFGYGTKIAGDCIIYDYVIFSSSVIANPGARVGKGAMIQSGCRFSKDVPPYIVATDNPVRYGGVNTLILTNHDVTEKVQAHIANAYRLIFHGQTSVFDAVIQVEEQVPPGKEINTIVEFIRGTKLGIISKI
ncbi:MAG: acyl-ACP--UDP-N-acetylglucosamine O-acyltransferase [Prevotellaceae bacterium]|nr:acyl-ACP--UDP-N-acetylglucosamine O-acyltransferase [Prevotellaceae bacterium]